MSKRSTSEAFTVTVALHIAAVAIMLVLGFLSEWVEEDPPVVMQLVDLSADFPVSRESSEAPAMPDPIPEEPEPTLAELEKLAIPDFEELEPAPEVPPLPEPEPQPQPKPRKADPPPPPKVSFSEHIQQHGPPKVTPPRKTERKPPPPPTIETNVRDVLSQSLSTPKLKTSESFSAAQTSALDAYVTGIQRSLQGVFRPVGAPGLKATVAFTVAPNGIFANYRIVKSSGDPAFDAAALAAFKRIGRYRPTPDRRTYEWEIDFRSKL